jgi:hypothetical protein
MLSITKLDVSCSSEITIYLFIYHSQVQIMFCFTHWALLKLKRFPYFTLSIENYDTVTYLLKARIVKPGKQSLLANGCETTSAAKQQFLNKQVYEPLLSNAFTNKQGFKMISRATVEELLETMPSTRPVPRIYITKTQTTRWNQT